MRNLPLALPRVWELYPSTRRKVTVGAYCFRQVDFGTPEAVTQGVRDTQYQQATPLDSQTDFPSVPSCGSLSGRFPETLVKNIVKKCRRILWEPALLRKETKELWQFFSGMFVGTWCGISLMCLVQVNRLHHTDREE